MKPIMKGLCNKSRNFASANYLTKTKMMEK